MDNGIPLDIKNKYYKQYVDGINNLFGNDVRLCSKDSIPGIVRKVSHL